MDTLYNSHEVAALTGRSRITVQVLAKRYALGRKVGRDYVFTQADINFIAGINTLGGRPSKSGTMNYKADPAAVKKGRPKKVPPEPRPAA